MHGRGPLFVALLMLSVAWAALVPTGAGQSEADSVVFSWKAPVDLRGSMIVELDLDFGPDNVCALRVAASGNGPFNDGMALWVTYNTGAVRAKFAMLDEGRTVSSRADGLFDTTKVKKSGNGDWAVNLSRLHQARGDGSLKVALFGAWSWGTSLVDSPLFLSVRCQEEITVSSKWAGRTALSVTDASINNGIGIRAGGYEVERFDGGRAERGFAEERVRFGLAATNKGLLDHGEVRVVSPEGTKSWGLAGRSFASAASPGGQHTLEMDRFDAGPRDQVALFLFGMDSVESFDEAL